MEEVTGSKICGKTICKNCKHFHDAKKNPLAPDVWYNFYCNSPKLKNEKGEERLDVVTGEYEFFINNRSTDDTGMLNCREVNDGNCEYFEEKTTWKNKLRKYL